MARSHYSSLRVGIKCGVSVSSFPDTLTYKQQISSHDTVNCYKLIELGIGVNLEFRISC